MKMFEILLYDLRSGSWKKRKIRAKSVEHAHLEAQDIPNYVWGSVTPVSPK